MEVQKRSYKEKAPGSRTQAASGKRVVSRKHHQCHALYRMGRHNGALQVSSFSPSLLSIFVQSFQSCYSNHLNLLIPTDDLLRL